MSHSQFQVFNFLHLHMHGLIFETSVSLLAESTRLLSNTHKRLQHPKHTLCILHVSPCLKPMLQSHTCHEHLILQASYCHHKRLFSLPAYDFTCPVFASPWYTPISSTSISLRSYHHPTSFLLLSSSMHVPQTNNTIYSLSSLSTNAQTQVHHTAPNYTELQHNTKQTYKNLHTSTAWKT